ncbi:MAG: FliO/MopB family protein [Alphaproteobacteria bacterium]
MEALDLVRFAAALVFVVALIAGLAWLVRRTGMAGRVAMGRNGRIGVVEIAGIDAKRRLVLVRRDDVEHLLVLSPTGETVVETGIVAPAAAVRPFAQRLAAASAEPREATP